MKALPGTRDLTDAELDGLDPSAKVALIPFGLGRCNACGRLVIDDQEAERQRERLAPAPRKKRR